MSYLKVLILAIIQGVCELLPVSSSAHVLVAAKLMGIVPSSPEMTFLLVMLHTGTMFAVIVYFWRAWKEDYFSSRAAFVVTLKQVVIATIATGIIGFGLQKVIEKVVLGHEHAEVEELFDNMTLIAASLAAVGILILLSGRGRSGGTLEVPDANAGAQIGVRESLGIGAVQGLCLPFRGFSRSGATISTGLLMGITRQSAEKFSFALAVILTPPVVAREGMRLLKAHHADPAATSFGAMAAPGLFGMVFSFLAGLLALRWLSSWLESGKWQWFGGYCLVASAVVFWLSTRA